MSKQTYTVSWCMPEEKILKIEETDKTYDISDKVHTFLESKGLYDNLEDQKVEVEIDEDKGENGTITHLSLVKDSKKSTNTSEKKSEDKSIESETKNEDLIVKELTINGVSVPNESVIFQEEEKVWYTLDKSIDVKELKDKYTKKMVEVSIRKTEEGNDVIVSYTPKEEPKEEKTEEVESNKKTSNSSYKDTQLSIESQQAVEFATRIVASMVSPDSKPDEVLRMITKIANHNFKTIQELKNK